MNTNSTESFRSESSFLYPDNSIDLSNSKREKFLFENEDSDPKISGSLTPSIHYRSVKNIVPDNFVMRLTVDAESVTELRQLVLSNCGGIDFYMKVKPVDHASKMKVWLCLNKVSIDLLISKILRALPQAEFGKITPIQAN